jgi:hypothetical protein
VEAQHALCVTHVLEVKCAIRRKHVTSLEYEEIHQMTYERLLGPEGLCSYASGRPFLFWLRDQVRKSANALFAQRRKERKIQRDEQGHLRAQHEERVALQCDAAARHDEARFWIDARESYCRSRRSSGDHGAFFDRVRELDGIDRDLAASDYVKLLREYPPRAGHDQCVEQPYAYLKKRVQSLREHVAAFRVEYRGATP